VGHEEGFPSPRLSGRCGFGEVTFARMRRNGRDAPKAGIRSHRTTQRRQKCVLAFTRPTCWGAPSLPILDRVSVGGEIAL
jgi:hypothetical protein